MLMICALANGQVKKELGLSAGTSLKGLNQVDTRIDFAWAFEVGPGLDLGFGTGLRYARPMHALKETDGVKVNEDYVNGLGLPLFIRLRYSFPGNFFIQADTGYQLGLLTLDIGKGYFYPFPGCRSLSGLFVEPQAGFSIAPGKTISFGLSLQDRKFLHQIQSGSLNSENYSLSDRTDHTLDAIVFVRYCIEL
jgi:hypothetical protein